MKKDPRAVKFFIGNALKRSGTMSMFIFFNIFIWNELNDFRYIILFNLSYASFHTASFLIMAKYFKNGPKIKGIVLSMILASVLFGIVAFFKEFILNHLIIFGFMSGFINSLYWVNFNSILYEITTFSNRGYYSGLRGSINTFGSIVTPIIVGGILSVDYLGLGYETAFTVGSLMFLGAAYCSYIPLKNNKQREYQFLNVSKKLIGNKKILLTNILYGLCSFAFSNILLETLLPFLMYIEVQEEYKLGILIGIISFGNVIISYLLGKFLSYHYYKYLFLLVGLLYPLVMIGIIIKPSLIVLFSALLSFLFVIFMLPVKVMIHNVFHEYKGHNKKISELMAFQEIFTMSGRIGALLAILFIGDFTETSLHILFFFMIILIIITCFGFYKIDISVNPKKIKKEAIK